MSRYADYDDIDPTTLEEGETVEVRYRSQRSGNRLSRVGEVHDFAEGDGEETPDTLRVHVGRPDTLEHKYVVVGYPLPDSDKVAGVHSVTTELENIHCEDTGKLSRTYEFRHEESHSTLLGSLLGLSRPSGEEDP